MCDGERINVDIRKNEGFDLLEKICWYFTKRKQKKKVNYYNLDRSSKFQIFKNRLNEWEVWNGVIEVENHVCEIVI